MKPGGCSKVEECFAVVVERVFWFVVDEFDGPQDFDFVRDGWWGESALGVDAGQGEFCAVVPGGASHELSDFVHFHPFFR